MASSSIVLVPPSEVVPTPITAIVPTLGRLSLNATLQTLNAQTVKPVILVKMSSDDTLIKLKEGVNEAKGEFVAVADDDAKYPNNWLENLEKAMSVNVGFVGGPCLPLLDETSGDAERCIAEVTASFFGTSNMSYRAKVKGRIKDADETNLIGNGLYRREIFAKILNEEYERIPPAAWETYVFTRIKKMGYRTLYNPQGLFYHKQRSNIFSFARQIFRSGMGRINFFKQFPKELATKFYILFPMIFVIYFILFFVLAMVNLPINGLPLVAYVGILMIVSYGFNKYKSRWLGFYYLVMHFSYGLGMIFGLFSNRRKWN